MGHAEIVSINIGAARQAAFRGRTVETGIYKSPAAGPVYLGKSNFEGDEQADRVHHGGPDKAVCVYPIEHYAYWEAQLGVKLACGAFGENLTVRGLTERDVRIGERFALGEAVVQVSQPRQPCYKLALKFGMPELPLAFQETGYTGYYFRVLREGLVDARDGLVPLDGDDADGVTVQFANRIMHHEKTNAAGIAKVVETEGLSANWRTTLLRRLDGVEPDTEARLTGNRRDARQ